MSNNPNTDKVREEIAILIAEDRYRDSFYGQYMTEHDREHSRKIADATLVLPNILVKAENQTPPDVFRGNRYNDPRYQDAAIYKAKVEAQQDMLKAGFVKVEEKK